MKKAIVLIMLGFFLASGSAPVLAQNSKQKKECCKQDTTKCKKADKQCCKKDQKGCCNKK